MSQLVAVLVVGGRRGRGSRGAVRGGRHQLPHHPCREADNHHLEPRGTHLITPPLLLTGAFCCQRMLLFSDDILSTLQMETKSVALVTLLHTVP